MPNDVCTRIRAAYSNGKVQQTDTDSDVEQESYEERTKKFDDLCEKHGIAKPDDIVAP